MWKDYWWITILSQPNSTQHNSSLSDKVIGPWPTPPPQTFRPLPGYPGSWFSASNPILTQLDDSCKKKLTQILFYPNFFYLQKFLTQILLTPKKFRPNFFWPNKFSDPNFFWPTNFFLSQKNFRPKFFLTQKNFNPNFFKQHFFGPKNNSTIIFVCLNIFFQQIFFIKILENNQKNWSINEKSTTKSTYISKTT